MRGKEAVFWFIGGSASLASLYLLVQYYTTKVNAEVPPVNPNPQTPEVSPTQIENTSILLAPFFYETPVGLWAGKLADKVKLYPNVDINQAATLMAIESCGNPAARSGSGATGLFQLLPQTFGRPEAELYDPDINIELGVGYLSGQLEATNGNFEAALAGYNGGPVARKWFMGEISRNDYISFLMSHPSGRWATWEVASAKADQVEEEAHWSHIYFDAVNGTRETFDEFQASGRCR